MGLLVGLGLGTLLLVGGIAIGLLVAVVILFIKGTVANIAVMDAIMIWFISFSLIHDAGLHTVFSILLALLAAGIFVALTKIPYFGNGLLIACGIAWAFTIYSLIDDWGLMEKLFTPDVYDESEHTMMMLLKNDPVWFWTIIILMLLVFVGLHIKCIIRSGQLIYADVGTTNSANYSVPTPTEINKSGGNNDNDNDNSLNGQ